MKQGFSLVELAIVLVIIGLVTGGIMTGQNLIRASEIRSISAQHNSFVTASFAFRNKYLALPGDVKNASNFWVGATNGNGDKQLSPATVSGGKGEMYGFWQQLMLAEMLEGSYSGNSGTGGTGLQDSVIGTNVPASKITSAGWTVGYIGTANSSNTDYFAGTYENAFNFGTKVTNDITSGAAITAGEAFDLDTKIDDGNPDSGKVKARKNLSTADNTSCVNTTTAKYTATNSAVACALVMMGL